MRATARGGTPRPAPQMAARLRALLGPPHCLAFRHVAARVAQGGGGWDGLDHQCCVTLGCRMRKATMW
eukprot:3823736-Alexandrium_andersonii.AAC.1